MSRCTYCVVVARCHSSVPYGIFPVCAASVSGPGSFCAFCVWRRSREVCLLSGASCLGLVCGRVQGRRVGVGGDGYRLWGATLMPDFWGTGAILL